MDEERTTQDISRPSKSYRLIGFDKVKSRHSVAVMKRIVEASISDAKKAWKWMPVNLAIQFHRSDKNFGFARNAGRGPANGITIVSLSHRLIREYDKRSVRGTLTHELCHHYRAEKFPPPPIHLRRGGHDPLFCSELAKVDKSAAISPERCRYFSDERIKPEFDRRVRWDPKAGLLRVVAKRGRMVFWTPKKAGAWTPAEFLMNDNELLDLAKRFKSKDWPTVGFVGSGINLAKFMAFAATKSTFPRTSEYVWSVARGTKIKAKRTAKRR